MAIGDKIYIADKPTLDEVKNKIGATTDTGGTTTAGGIFAKLNAILQQFMSNWTAVRAVKIDTIDTKIGSTTDTGGSKTTGTTMGKLNKILTDTIYIPSDVVQRTAIPTEVSAGIGGYKIFEFTPLHDGAIRVSADLKGTSESRPAYLFAFNFGDEIIENAYGYNFSIIGNMHIFLKYMYQAFSIPNGSVISGGSWVEFARSTNMPVVNVINGSYYNYDFTVSAKKNQKISFVIASNYESGIFAKNFKIYYDEVEV